MRSSTKIGVLAFLAAGLLLAVQASAILWPCDTWCKSYKPCNTLCEDAPNCGVYGCCIGHTSNCEPGFTSSSASQTTFLSWLSANEETCAPGAVSLPADTAQPVPALVTEPVP
jgi:hypothetical protein